MIIVEKLPTRNRRFFMYRLTTPRWRLVALAGLFLFGCKPKSESKYRDSEVLNLLEKTKYATLTKSSNGEWEVWITRGKQIISGEGATPDLAYRAAVKNQVIGCSDPLPLPGAAQ